jgi:G2/mitotic-specific cyclin 3/4
MLIDCVYQPQRPARMTRVYGDENMVPANGLHKTIHHRNKSSPALSSLIHAGGLKAAAKRTAFGDVSNTSNWVRPSKDDSSIGAKAGYPGFEKPVALQQDKKNAALLRPAQRPLSVTGLKNILNNVTNTSSQAVVKQPRVENHEPVHSSAQVANIRKTLTKRSTAVFKDLSNAQPSKTHSDLLKPSSMVISAAPVELPVLGREGKGDEDHEPQHRPRRTKSKSRLEVEDSTSASNLPESSDEAGAIRSDGIYIDNNGEIQVYQYHTEDDQETGPPIIPRKIEIHPTETKLLHHNIHPAQVVETDEEPPRPELSHKHRLTSVSEPEEYWDEEEEEELYEEDGYVTARSYKSRGENTMSGATTILFPKMNQKAKRELAAAKELIERAKISEEFNDESWDTTMVAEYGEEIFQYMRDLEVSRAPIVHRAKRLTGWNRSGCFPILTTWITKQKFNGQCAPS